MLIHEKIQKQTTKVKFVLRSSILTLLIFYTTINLCSSKPFKIRCEVYNLKFGVSEDKKIVIERIVKEELKGDELCITLHINGIHYDERYSRVICLYANETLFVSFKRRGNHSIERKCCECSIPINKSCGILCKIRGLAKTNIAVSCFNRMLKIDDQNFQTFPISFSMENGDTINYFDKYGLKQGTFIDYTSTKQKFKYSIYKDGNLVKQDQYYDNGKCFATKEYLDTTYKSYKYARYDYMGLPIVEGIIKPYFSQSKLWEQGKLVKEEITDHDKYTVITYLSNGHKRECTKNLHRRKKQEFVCVDY